MNFFHGLVIGVLTTAALGAAAQCGPSDDLKAMVKVFDTRTKQLIADCRVTISLMDGHHLMCDRGIR